MSTLEELRTNKPKTIEDVDAWLAAYMAAGEKARAETLALERLHDAAPAMHGALIEAAQAAQDAYEAALQDVPEGSCVPPWITRLQQAAERAHAALVMADERFKPRLAA